MKRTQQEILDRMEEVTPHDLFGFKQEVLITCLDFEHAKHLLKEGVDEAQWDEARESSSSKTAAENGADYLPFAIRQIENERGISAIRSVEKFVEWAWLDGEEELASKMEEEDNYGHYGETAVRMYADHYGLEWRAG